MNELDGLSALGLGGVIQWILMIGGICVSILAGPRALFRRPVRLAAFPEPASSSMAAGHATAKPVGQRSRRGHRPATPDALADLSFGAVRRVLIDMVDGKAPRDLPPGDTDELARHGFGVLIGLRIDWAIPV